MEKQLAIVNQEQVEDWADRFMGVLTSTAKDYVHEVREIASANVARVEKELVRLNKIAAKHDQPQSGIYLSTEQYVREVQREEWVDGEQVVRRKQVLFRLLITSTPESIGLDGWELAAKVTHLGGENAVIANFPGWSVPDWPEFRQNVCQHCRTYRNRNETIVVARPSQEHGDREYMVVGKDCLKEVLGIDPAYALALAGWYEATGLANHTDRYEEALDEWLGWVAVAVRLDGRYWSRDAANRENEERYSTGSFRLLPEQKTTVNHAHILYSESINNREAPRPTDEDRATVEAVKGYVATLDPDMSQYNANLTAVFRAGIVVEGVRALAASAFAAYLREQRAVAEARNRPPVSNRHLGTVGEKLSLQDVTVGGVFQTEGAYGTTWIYSFASRAGEVIKWFSSRDMGLTYGDKLARLTGTVKAHGEWKGTKETILTRCHLDR